MTPTADPAQSPRGRGRSPRLTRDLIINATAELLRAEGQLGTLAVGAQADVVVLDGDPLQDIGLLADPAAHMPLVIQAGAVGRQR